MQSPSPSLWVHTRVHHPTTDTRWRPSEPEFWSVTLTIFRTMMILGPRVLLMVKMAMRRRQKTTKSMQRMTFPA